MRLGWLIAGIIAMLVGIFTNGCAKAPKTMIEGKVQPGIWDYENIKQQPRRHLFIRYIGYYHY